MATAHHPQSARLPALSAARVRLLIEKTQDLTLLIDHDLIVIDALQTEAFSTADVSHWIGHPLKSILGPESLEKLDILLLNDVSEDSSDIRWRHINLSSSRGGFIPVLARYLVLKGELEETRMLVMRDLRAQQTTNDRFAAAQRETELTYTKRLQELQGTIQSLTNRIVSDVSDVSVEHILAQVENARFDKVIADTARSLEKRCLLAILQGSGGNHELAAKTVKMSIDEWMNELQKHSIG